MNISFGVPLLHFDGEEFNEGGATVIDSTHVAVMTRGLLPLFRSRSGAGSAPRRAPEDVVSFPSRPPLRELFRHVSFKATSFLSHVDLRADLC